MFAIPHTLRSFHVTRATVAGAMLATSALAMSGCGIHFATSPGALPTLGGADLVRDNAVRIEAATAKSADLLADAATECTSCHEALASVAAAARQRETVLGGVWDPWQGEVYEDAQQAAPVADAPVEVPALVTWMLASAHRDIDAATNVDVFDGEQARAVTLVAMSRAASALELARAYNLPVDAGSPALRATIERASQAMPGPVDQATPDQSDTGSDDPSRNPAVADQPESAFVAEATPAWAMKGPAGMDPGQYPWALETQDIDAVAAATTARSRGAVDELSAAVRATEDAVADPALASAVQAWDCAAQAAVRANLVSEELPNGEAVSDALLIRSEAFLAAGVADTRVFRCDFPENLVEGTYISLLEASLTLMSSEVGVVRNVGAQFLFDDVSIWAPQSLRVTKDLYQQVPLPVDSSQSVAPQSGQ